MTFFLYELKHTARKLNVYSSRLYLDGRRLKSWPAFMLVMSASSDFGFILEKENWKSSGF